MTGGNNVASGTFGQQTAEDFLKAAGCTVLARNFRCPSGEIDLIVRDGGTIVFVEVKYRRTPAYGYPREAVGFAKQKRITRAAQVFIMRFALRDQDFRFDVIEVLGEMDRAQVTHITNAF